MTDPTEKAEDMVAYGVRFTVYRDKYGEVDEIMHSEMVCNAGWEEALPLLRRAESAHKKEVNHSFPVSGPVLWLMTDLMAGEGVAWVELYNRLSDEEHTDLRHALLYAAELLVEPEDLQAL